MPQLNALFQEHDSAIQRLDSDVQRQDADEERQQETIVPRRRQAGRPVPRHAEREPENNPRFRRSTPSTVSRPRATPSERYLRRSHARLREQRSTETDSANDMADIDAAMIDIVDNAHRQPKRRKLDHETRPASEYDYYKYGYEGQAVSTRLKMEVASCDGGEFEWSESERLYKVQNVLSNDKSVYCSRSSRCNLLLKHVPEAPFCLEKIVIRAPNRGFTAPVQEGLIFVSMTSDNLLSGTEAYQLEYDSRSPPMSPVQTDPEDQLLSLRDAVEDPHLWMQSRQAAIEERIERLRLRRGRLQTEMAERDRLREERRSANAEDETAEYCPYHVDEGEPTAIGVSAPTPPPFTITTESGQEESDENAAQPSAAVMADRLRRDTLWRPESDDEEEGDDLLYRYPPLRRAQPLDLTGNVERRWRGRQSINPIRRAAPLRAPSRIEPKESETEADGLIAPHARFFIARHKNKITIKFHPVISGRYVLLKLWSPTHDGNIDIESVQFYGYSGPRYFPAVQTC
ncbi:hypothetical protein K458DRAFT_321277 [Lentithecium fluviatile CBS 122367]|uniref:Uncharacterized protein n=1 Tax=Lentithecium fluviatile CBS 122367 TaxID=1168545 RepID=A0A6G1IEY1_9PLEO|nr:hypothetical protein K458DRAFT_321277 [Lentithecium fluviatile CBS 122367]